MPIGIITLHLLIPGCTSLKDKRSHVKPIVARLHREFNLSVAEMGHLDAWQETEIACVTVSNEFAVVQHTLQLVTAFVESHWPDCPIADEKKEII